MRTMEHSTKRAYYASPIYSINGFKSSVFSNVEAVLFNNATISLEFIKLLRFYKASITFLFFNLEIELSKLLTKNYVIVIEFFLLKKII